MTLTPEEEAQIDLAADYAKMIVEKWRGLGQPSFDLAAALSWETMKILAENGMCAEEIAHSFEALADQIRHDMENARLQRH